MELTLMDEGGARFVEGPPAGQLMGRAEDVDRVVEACLSEGAQAALLHAPNMPGAFFDLSSGEAGVVLQKLRTYGIRLALVCPPGSASFSSRFGEMVDDERRGTHFGLFEGREAAVDWLRQNRVQG